MDEEAGMTELTEQQVTFFETFGYLGFPGLMADPYEEIVREFEAVWAGRGGGLVGADRLARRSR